MQGFGPRETEFFYESVKTYHFVQNYDFFHQKILAEIFDE